MWSAFCFRTMSLLFHPLQQWIKHKKVWSRFASTHWGSGRTLRMKYDRYSTLDDMRLVAGCDMQQYQRRAECLCRRPSLKFTRFQCWTTRKHFRYMSVKKALLPLTPTKLEKESRKTIAKRNPTLLRGKKILCLRLKMYATANVWKIQAALFLAQLLLCLAFLDGIQPWVYTFKFHEISEKARNITYII